MPEVTITGVPKFDDFEIIKTGNVSVSYTASSYQATNFITHNLGFVPSYLLYVQTTPGDSSTFSPTPFSVYLTSGGDAGKLSKSFYGYADSTTLTCVVNASSVSPQFATNFTTIFKYYLLRFKAESS